MYCREQKEESDEGSMTSSCIVSILPVMTIPGLSFQQSAQRSAAGVICIIPSSCNKAR